MMLLLGDTVTVTREIMGEVTYITGRVSGIVQNDNGDLKYFYIRGIDSSLWMSDGWQFEDDYTVENDEGDDDNG
jgi:hypothetical protein